MSRPPKVRPINLTFGGFFVWQNTGLNFNLNMSRKETRLDNPPMENFFSTLKQEVYYGKI